MGFDDWYGALHGAGPAYRRVLRGAFGTGQLVGQQGLCSADEILHLVRELRPEPGGRLLDVCCGPAGPAGQIARQLGCEVVGLDRSPGALALAHRRGAPGVRLVRGDATRLPFQAASFQAVLVLDSLASIFEPEALLAETGRVLSPGGRLGCTLEVGQPLHRVESDRLEPGVEACILPLDWWLGRLERTGFRTLWVEDTTTRRATTAARLVRGLVRERLGLHQELGAEAVDGLTESLSVWTDFLKCGRLRAVSLVAEWV